MQFAPNKVWTRRCFSPLSRSRVKPTCRSARAAPSEDEMGRSIYAIDHSPSNIQGNYVLKTDSLSVYALSRPLRLATRRRQVPTSRNQRISLFYFHHVYHNVLRFVYRNLVALPAASECDRLKLFFHNAHLALQLSGLPPWNRSRR